MTFRRYKKLPLNSADYARIEAALRADIELCEAHAEKYGSLNGGEPKGLPAMRRTLDKIERINGTGQYTVQWPDGPTLRESQQFIARRGEL